VFNSLYLMCRWFCSSVAQLRSTNVHLTRPLHAGSTRNYFLRFTRTRARSRTSTSSLQQLFIRFWIFYYGTCLITCSLSLLVRSFRLRSVARWRQAVMVCCAVSAPHRFPRHTTPLRCTDAPDPPHCKLKHHRKPQSLCVDAESLRLKTAPAGCPAHTSAHHGRKTKYYALTVDRLPTGRS